MVADTSDSTKFRIVLIRKASKEESDDEENLMMMSLRSLMMKRSPTKYLTRSAILKTICRLDHQVLLTVTQQFTLKVGQWVVVNYDGLIFPGEVTACGETDAEISVMHRSGNAWRWPINPDKIFYEHQNILRQISPPKASGNRGQFNFDDIL